jgi:hemoglobin
VNNDTDHGIAARREKGGAPAVRRDITGREDIAALLTDFYARAFDDALLGPVFVDIAGMNLAEHLPVIGDFWQTVLFHTGQYRRNALHPHLQLHALTPLTPAHFERWLTLWQAAVDDRHAGPTAEVAKRQATRIAGSMSRRITGHVTSRLDHACAPGLEIDRGDGPGADAPCRAAQAERRQHDPCARTEIGA